MIASTPWSSVPIEEVAEIKNGQRKLVKRTVLPGYVEEGKRFATVAVGCTGGKHRSVAMTDELSRRLAAQGIAVNVVHRDMGRE